MTAAAPASKQSVYRIEALAKGLRVLSVFTQTHPTWRLTDIAAETAIPLPTAFRIVATLVEEQFLELLPSGEYRPAARVLTLGGAALRGLDLVDVATPALERLAARTGETVNLAILAGDRILYLFRRRNADLVTANIQVGSTLPAVSTSMGKVLLAFLDRDVLDRSLTSASFQGSRGPRAIPDLVTLRPQLAAIRKRGWAVQDEETASGLRSVAAPLTGPAGRPVAAVNIAVSARDWTLARVERTLRPELLSTCAEISAVLQSQ